MVLAFDSHYSGSNSLSSGVWWWMKRGWGQWVIFPCCGYFDVLTAVGWVTGRTSELWKPMPLTTIILFQNRWRKEIERDLANPGSSGKRPLMQRRWIGDYASVTDTLLKLTQQTCINMTVQWQLHTTVQHYSITIKTLKLHCGKTYWQCVFLAGSLIVFFDGSNELRQCTGDCIFWNSDELDLIRSSSRVTMSSQKPHLCAHFKKASVLLTWRADTNKCCGSCLWSTFSVSYQTASDIRSVQ